MRKFTVNNNDSGQRLDKFVTKATEGMPKSLLYKFIRTKRIKLNGGRAHENDILSVGDVIEMYIPDEFFGGADDTPDYSKVKVKPDIVYEDENIILCNKKPGILVHLGDEGDKNRADAAERETLIFALTAYLVNKGEYDPSAENSFAPALCNRIDRNTGGIVILAKNAPTLRAINEAIRENRVHKRYLCAVHGKLNGERTLTAYHTKDHRTNTVRIFDRQVPGSREIITKYKSLAYNGKNDLTLLGIDLITGRTHQIRAHMAHIGHPLLGEGKYARNAEDRRLGFSSQALYSSTVEFELDGELKYLSGKVFSVKENCIDFLRLFPGFSFERDF
ncbi:MAG: RluA family pseudouridine synthase [Clostridia bacterium]|nr:RluA family pseudouridine synthase [Clostridia bacterium]